MLSWQVRLKKYELLFKYISKGHFIWDNSKDDVEFSNWDAGQPDDSYDDGEDCVEMNSFGAWNDFGCYYDSHGSLYEVHAVCQVNAILQ